MFAVASGTAFWHSLFVAAVMALHAMRGLVEGQGDGAVLALQRLPARPAQNDGGIATAVQQNHGLLAALQALADFADQPLRKERVFILAFAPDLEFHVHQFHFRQRAAFHPFL